MTTTTLDAAPAAAASVRVPPGVWLLLGIVLTALTSHRFNIAALAWVQAVPFLLYLRQTDGWRSRAWFFGAMQLAVWLQLLKIITDPIPWPFSLMFSVPSATGTAVLFLLFEAWRRRLGDKWGLALFVALSMGSDWLGWTTSEMGSWGSPAYSQLGDLPLMQLASVFGLTGISGLLALSQASLALLWTAPRSRLAQGAVLTTVLLVLAAHGFGVWRLAQPLTGPQVTVAAVVTDLPVSALEEPDDTVLTAGTEQLFDRTREAARRSAELVVWNEGATLVTPDAEQAFVARGRALADGLGVELVLAYIVPLTSGPDRYEKKYVWLAPGEGIVETYLKHHPVPGEGARPRAGDAHRDGLQPPRRRAARPLGARAARRSRRAAQPADAGTDTFSVTVMVCGSR